MNTHPFMQHNYAMPSPVVVNVNQKKDGCAQAGCGCGCLVLILGGLLMLLVAAAGSVH